MALRAPFPWFGGKSRVAPIVWERLGDVAVYAEPFAGSLAVLLGRPGNGVGDRVETVGDLDGFIANAWRAILHDPEATAHHADWPVNENCLTARHAWLTEQRASLVARLEGNPDFYDAKIAGWWLWGIACWIGGGFCSGRGPWHREEAAPGDWRLVKTATDGQGVNRQLMHLGSAGGGVNRQLVHLGNTGRGVTRRLVHLGNAGQGVNRKLVHLGDAGLIEWLVSLSERLRRVRVCCGDWRRIVTPAALASGVLGTRGIFLDPPYSAEANRDGDIYSCEDLAVSHEVHAWCLAADPAYRIALCGYEEEGHEALEAAGWSVYAWAARGGISRDRGSGSGGNNERERIWFSPACANTPPRQLTLGGVW